MRILHITNGYPSKKSPTYCIFIKEQIESLNSLGISNNVFVINPYKNGIVGYLFGYLRLFAFLNFKKNSFDAVHCHHVLSFLIYFFCFKKFKTILSFLNEREVEIKNLGFSKFITKQINAYIDKHVSTFIYKNSASLNNLNNHFYLPNGVNIDFFYPMDKNLAKNYLGLDLKAKYILFVSSVFIRPQKRYDLFKGVINILKETDSSISELLLINESREKVPYFFNASDIHLLTSDYEGSPNSVKEAMSCNVPVVSTNVGNVSELFEGTSNCILSDSTNILDIANFCKLALIQSERNSRYKIIEMGLDINSVALRLKSIYQYTINEKK